MKPWIAACFTVLLPLGSAYAQEAPPLELPSKVAEATVYADRARVVRTATADLAPGVGRYAFPKLPGWLDEGSVRLAVLPADAAELLDVEVRTTYLARPDDAALRQAEEAMQEIADQAAGLEDERAVLDAQSRQLDSIRAFSLEKMPKDSVVREVKVDEYAGVVKFVGDAMGQLARSRRELERKRRALEPEMRARQQRLEQLRQRAQLEQRTVIVTLRNGGAARKAGLRLTYMLPGATWEPAHDLRTDGAADKVALASFGIVSQTTGEDWEGVTLALSTQSATDTIRIPELEKLLVGAGAPPVRADTFSVASGKFAGQIAVWNRFANGNDAQVEFDNNLDVQRKNTARNARVFEKLQEKRGTTAHFTAAGGQTVRSDGRPVRVPIGAEQLAAKPKIVATPAVSLNAARTVELTNTGKQPLLPGKVLLYVDGAFLGTTELDFVAPGEAFPVFIGVADQVKLSRALDKRRSSLTWTGKRTRMQAAFVLTVENLGEKAAVVQLADRIPVSETDEVRVTGVEIEPEARPDTKGVLRWEVNLPPKAKKEFRVAYSLDYPRDLPRRAVMPGEAPEAAAPADMLKQQIDEVQVMLQ